MKTTGAILSSLVYLAWIAPAHAVDAGGSWNLSLKCNYWNLWAKTTLEIPRGSNGAFRGSGSPIGSVSGTVNGNSITFGDSSFTARGSISGSSMSGNWTSGTGSCTFTGNRVASGKAIKDKKSATAKSNDQPDEQSEDQSQFIRDRNAALLKQAAIWEREAKTILRSANCGNIRRADILIAKASVHYKVAGNLKKNAELNRLGEKISGEGGARDRCNAIAKNKTTKKSIQKGLASKYTKAKSDELKEACKNIIFEVARRKKAKLLSDADANKQLKASGCWGLKFED